MYLNIEEIEVHMSVFIFQTVLHYVQPAYKLSLQTSCGDQPSLSQQRSHLLSHFKVVENNLQHYNARKTLEGLMITLNRPDLNKQVLHRSTALVCKCILPTETTLPPGV